MRSTQPKSKPFHQYLRQIFIGILLAGGLLWWAGRGLAFNEVVDILSSVSLSWICFSLMCAVGVAIAKTIRWQSLYGPYRNEVTFYTLFTALMSAQVLNVMVPLRIGEVVRAGLMRQNGQPISRTLGTIVVEKMIDLWVVVILAMSLLLLTTLPQWLRETTTGTLLVAVVVLLALLAAYHWREDLIQILDRVMSGVRVIPEQMKRKVLQIAQSFFETLTTFTNWSIFLPVIGWTICVWLLSVATVMALFLAFHLSFAILMGLMLTVAISFGNITPVPGMVGVIQAITVAILGQFDIAQSTAFGIGLVLNIAMVGPLLLLGGWALSVRASAIFNLFSNPEGVRQA